MVIKTISSKKRKDKSHWAMLDQQISVPPKKGFRSEIKLQDACSHVYQELEKMEQQVSKIE